jgi:hypothetical protein
MAGLLTHRQLFMQGTGLSEANPFYSILRRIWKGRTEPMNTSLILECATALGLGAAIGVRFKVFAVLAVVLLIIIDAALTHRASEILAAALIQVGYLAALGVQYLMERNKKQ